MERVITYSRVSTDEQADKGYSLRDQQAKLESYCTTKNYIQFAHYEDDFSAKTFERPAFQKLLASIKKNKKTISKLVFTRWDRFSRNITEALIMIRELSAYGVTCEAIDQPLDLSVPENKLLLIIYLTTPEIENDRRSLNTTMGMRRSMKEGRYCSTAPFGYKYSRDEKNKPILIPNTTKADLVLEAFELYSTGLYDKEAVRRKLKPKGMTLGRNRFAYMFHTVLYAGKIHIKAYKEEPEEVVEGIHTPIVSEALYEKVQQVALGKRPITTKKKTTNEALPLRGFLQCPKCGGNLTGSASKARNKTKHYYYHCQSPCRTRFRADTANQTFEVWLHQISLKPEHIDHYLKFYETALKKQGGDRKKEVKEITQEIEKLTTLNTEATKLFVKKELEKDAYDMVREEYLRNIAQLEAKKEALQSISNTMIDELEFGFKVMANLQNLWQELEGEGKKALLGSIFSGKLIFENNEYRTTETNPLLTELFAIDSSFEAINKKDGTEISVPSREVAPRGIEPLFPG